MEEKLTTPEGCVRCRSAVICTARKVPTTVWLVVKLSRVAKLSFDELDLQCTQIDDLNAFERSTLDDWIDKFQHYKGYPVVGRWCITSGTTSTTDLPTMTKSQLFGFRGKQDVKKGRISASIYVGLKGKVFDVSFGGEELYGEGGPYHIFAGIDASRALENAGGMTESDDLSICLIRK